MTKRISPKGKLLLEPAIRSHGWWPTLSFLEADFEVSAGEVEVYWGEVMSVLEEFDSARESQKGSI